MATQYEMVRLSEAASTQDDALRRLGPGPDAVAIVSCERQTAGRGRAGRPWLHAPRAVAVSVAFRPDATLWPIARIPIITLVSGLAARDIFDHRVRLKWPNDVMFDGVKAGGILSERHDDVVVVGLGVNLWWPSAPEGMVGLFAEDPGAEGAHELAERWAAEVLERQSLGPDEWGHDRYVEVCETIGMDITWGADGRGRAIAVDDSGGLVVDTGDGVETIRSGEVSLVRPAAIPAAGDSQEPSQ